MENNLEKIIEDRIHEINDVILKAEASIEDASAHQDTRHLVRMISDGELLLDELKNLKVKFQALSKQGALVGKEAEYLSECISLNSPSESMRSKISTPSVSIGYVEKLSEKLMEKAMTRTDNEFGFDKLEIGFHDTIIQWVQQLTPSKISIGEIEKKAELEINKIVGHIVNGMTHPFTAREDLKKLFTDFAKSIFAPDAVEFAEWIKFEGYKMSGSEWYKEFSSDHDYTTPELYSLFSSNKEGGK